MFRSLFALALSLFIVAETNAQTTPTTKKATPKAAARQAKRTTKKAERVARKATPKPAVAAAVTDDGWPPIEAAAPVATASAAAEIPVHMRAEDVVYAGPGMAVRLQTNKMVPYSVRPPRKRPTTETTLSPVAANW